MPSTATDRLSGLTTSVAMKAPCHVATTAAITLSGLQTVDGVALAAGNRVLVKDQVDTTQNGIWNAASGTWTRAKDFDGSLDAVKGTLIPVAGGTTAGDTIWRVSSADGFEIGSGSIAFEIATLTSRSLVSGLEFVTPQQFGAVGDMLRCDSVSMTSGSAVLTGSGFTSADVGKAITVNSAGGGTYSAPLITTILSYQSPHPGHPCRQCVRNGFRCRRALRHAG
jgi:phage-related tail fiber protein